MNATPGEISPSREKLQLPIGPPTVRSWSSANRVPRSLGRAAAFASGFPTMAHRRAGPRRWRTTRSRGRSTRSADSSHDHRRRKRLRPLRRGDRAPMITDRGVTASMTNDRCAATR